MTALGPGCKSSVQMALDPACYLQQWETITSGDVIAFVALGALVL